MALTVRLDKGSVLLTARADGRLEIQASVSVLDGETVLDTKTLSTNATQSSVDKDGVDPIVKYFIVQAIELRDTMEYRAKLFAEFAGIELKIEDRLAQELSGVK